MARILVAVLVAVLTAGSLAGPAMAAKAKSKHKGKSKPEPAGELVGMVDKLGTKQLKIAKSSVGTWLRFADPEGDLVGRDGEAAAGGPDWGDLISVAIASGPAPTKLLRKLDQDYPLGAANAYRGVDADWQAGQEGLYLVATTAGKLPTDEVPDVQLIVTFDGPEAMPVQAGSPLGPYAGAQSFSISGPFQGTAWASGTTELAGWDISQAIPFYNGPSRDMGYYDRKTGSFMHVARVPRDATSATVTLRSGDADGVYLDELRLPSGGRFFGLDSPGWGLKVGDKAPVLLACRSLATRSSGAPGGEDLEPGTSRVTYVVGWGEDAAAGDQIAGLGDSLSLVVTAVGSDEPPMSVDAGVTLDEASSTASFDLVVPDGRWTIAFPEGEELTTSSGQALLDLRPLTGSGGVLTGPGLDGFVAGDASCGTAPAGDTPAADPGAADEAGE